MRYEGLRVGTARRRMLHTNAGVGEGNPIEMNQPRERKKSCWVAFARSSANMDVVLLGMQHAHPMINSKQTRALYPLTGSGIPYIEARDNSRYVQK